MDERQSGSEDEAAIRHVVESWTAAAASDPLGNACLSAGGPAAEAGRRLGGQPSHRSYGVPRNVSVAHSIADSVPAQHHDVAVQMDKSAVACVKRFRFVAATLDGKPVATQGRVKMNFHHTMGQ